MYGSMRIEKAFPSEFTGKDRFLNKAGKIQKLLTKFYRDKSMFKSIIQRIIDLHARNLTDNRKKSELRDILANLDLILTDELVAKGAYGLTSLLEDVSRELKETPVHLPLDFIEKGKELASLYVKLYCLENALRQFIDTILIKDSNENYANNFPSAIKNKVRARKEDEKKNRWIPIRGDKDIFYVDFPDLAKIISAYWSTFESYFPSQNWINTKIEELSKIRNLVAHHSYVKQDDRQRVDLYFKDILSQISQSQT